MSSAPNMSCHDLPLSTKHHHISALRPASGFPTKHLRSGSSQHFQGVHTPEFTGLRSFRIRDFPTNMVVVFQFLSRDLIDLMLSVLKVTDPRLLGQVGTTCNTLLVP